MNRILSGQTSDRGEDHRQGDASVSRVSGLEATPSRYWHRGAVVVLAGTIAAEPVERRMLSGDEVTGRTSALILPR